MKEFDDVRNWGEMRGLKGASSQVQYQRFLQEAVEIHEAMVDDDDHEFKDAIGDTIVTLIMLAGTQKFSAEDCLKQAFDVIRYRKGLTKNGSFVRYGKLSQSEKDICDQKQGTPNCEYFIPDLEHELTPDDFKA